MKILLKRINNIAALQTFQLIRFITFLIISIVFTKSNLSLSEIGEFEAMLFFASFVSYFWLTGIIQSFLPLYKNNTVFENNIDSKHKSQEIFNAFIIISIFSFFLFIFGHSLKHNIYIFGGGQPLPHSNLLLIYILISNPCHIIEYIYLLRNKPLKLLRYTLITHVIQLLFVCTPIIIGMPVEYAVWGLIAISVIRLVWVASLLRRFALLKISFKFIATHLKLGWPLIISTLLSGSAQYVDGLIVALKYNNAHFAIFRFGAKELPFVIMLASGLNGAMIPEFANTGNMHVTLNKLKEKTERLIKILFPLTIVFLFFSDLIFPALFNQQFARSSDVFMMYILLIYSRLLFPHTILIGLKKTRIIMVASFFEIILNIILSLWLIVPYGLVGVALATVIMFLLEKIFLIGYNYWHLKIHPKEYIPFKLYLIYSIVLLILFILIDHRIIDVF